MKQIFMAITIATLLFSACNSNKTDDTTNGTDSASNGMNSKPDMKERNKETAMASEKAANDHNTDEVLKNVTADFVDYGDGSMPPIKGSDSAKAFIKMFMASFPDYKGENLMALADGDHVAVIGDWSGTFKKDLMGMKATNKQFKVKDVDIFTFNSDGKITEHRSIQSMDNIFRQLGTSMPKKH
ncbi:MAG TPA: ester cyclase [Segetibacter sp.]|nr:ester cyclase [Segetibacter sp.]